MILGYRWWKFLILSPVLVVVLVGATIGVAGMVVMDLFLDPVLRWGQR